MTEDGLVEDEYLVPDEAEPALEAVTELSSPAPSQFPQHGEPVNPVVPVEPAVDSPEPAAVVAEPAQSEEMPNE